MRWRIKLKRDPERYAKYRAKRRVRASRQDRRDPLIKALYPLADYER